MDYDQQMYYFTVENGIENAIYYLVSHQEKRYCVIPKEYHKLARNLYGVHLNCVGRTIEDVTEGYELRTLDDFSEYDI